MTDKIITPFVEIPANKRSLSIRKPLYNLGINDADYVVQPRINGKKINCPYYKTWVDMLTRCYSEKFHANNQSYIDCTVAKEWHLFSNFHKWMEKQDWNHKELDKDILMPGNKIYSPETCVFVPASLNNLLLHAKSKKRKYPVGVEFNNKCKDKFIAHVNLNGKKKHLGCFATQEQASEAHKTAKSNEIKRVALLQSDIRIREGLLRHADNLLNS